MIKKYHFGKPYNTEAVILPVPLATDTLPYFEVSAEKGLSFKLKLEKSDAVYGLGEAMRGINKRGYIYNSFCSDDPNHTEATRSLYGAHNFIVIEMGEKVFGAFFDTPSTLTFDVCYTAFDTLRITCENENMAVYIIDGDSIYDIVKEFRNAIGRSYIPPMWAFGYTQSRWSYIDKADVRRIAKGYRDLGIPLDAIYLDIDYMERYKDFTVNEENFGNLPEFVEEMKADGIRLVPIIDAGVKIEEGYDVYEEGIRNNYFCSDKDNKPFKACVWPGMTHFPDFLNPQVRTWFGAKYKILTDMGIEGFWNDMNEPAIFFSQNSVDETHRKIKKMADEEFSVDKFNELKFYIGSRQNCNEDYSAFYHNTPEGRFCHKDVHNLYGYNMTRSAGEALDKIEPSKRHLLFSRASYIGMHRYGGIWTGDNHSWWSHILNEIKVLPSLNMCGFLYVGADLGGFGCDTSRDLLLRWLSLGIFTPLMRNHAAAGTREQECFCFENPEDFKHIIDLRYRLIPYLYSEFMKASLENEMMFKPLAFEFPKDEVARHTEDQLLIGNELMIAPVYTQNALGRYVYLPEDMTAVRMTGGELSYTEMHKGHHFVEIAENEVVFFIRAGKAIPLCKAAKCVEDLDLDTIELVGTGKEYLLYTDDGFSKDYENPANFKTLKK
ncbi:MAG: glycoside hydrolase family 31 protein [Eubacteriales bacterium]|nr:glycoside hydrolase family 31 protein [Eubacteriales bacterium]